MEFFGYRVQVRVILTLVLIATLGLSALAKVPLRLRGFHPIYHGVKNDVSFPIPVHIANAQVRIYLSLHPI